MYQPLVTSALLNWIDQKHRDSHVKFRLHFSTKCIHVEPYSGRVVTEDSRGKLDSAVYDLVVGCDGARSVVKQAVTQQAEVSAESYPIPILWKFFAFDLKDTYSLRRAFWSIDQCGGGCWHMLNNKVAIVWTLCLK